MNMNEALQQSLYDKLSREQDKYRDWLKGQPPEEILHHSYEYTVREDILMSMEELTQFLTQLKRGGAPFITPNTKEDTNYVHEEE